MAEANMHEGPSERESSFEERLKAAQARQRLEGWASAERITSSGAVTSPVSVGLRVGIELVVALVVGVAIGLGLDRLFGTKPILTVIFFPVGAAAGVWNVWRVVAPKTGQE
jgi:ATP synthase protein I